MYIVWTDDSKEVVSKAVGTVLIKFHSDHKNGLEDGTGTTTEEQKFRDELGFSLMYSYKASCQEGYKKDGEDT